MWRYDLERRSKDALVGAASERPGGVEQVRLPWRPRRGIPALLDWIEEAEAVNRPMAARLLVAALIPILILVALTRLGCVP